MNVQEEVKSVDQQSPVQEVKTDGGKADVILPQAGALSTQVPELGGEPETDLQWTSGEPDVVQERTRSGEDQEWRGS